MSLWAGMGKLGGLPWGRIVTAEQFHHDKPGPETDLGACELLSLERGEVMMGAAHKSDRFAAKAAGLATGFVRRPLEHGPEVKKDLKADLAFDINSNDFLDLARRLGP